MAESLPTEDVLALMTSRFTSANDVPVERAHITRKEWDAFLSTVEDVLYNEHTANRETCQFCRLLRAVNEAREKLR